MLFSPEDCGCEVVQEGPSIVGTPVCSGTYLFMMYLQSFLWGRCDIATPCKRIVSVEEPSAYYDFIVVGSGPAGAIVAGRLSEDPSNKVMLIEAGGIDPIGSRIPSFYMMYWGVEEMDWMYYTEPDNYCLDQGGKGCRWPRGKVLGGSAVLNGMMYHRGHAADFETWVERGATGWSWEELQPYFDMTEGNREIGSLVSAEYHSDSGPLPVQKFNYQPPAVDVLLRAINETGIPIITDMNDPATPEGFTTAQAFTLNGQRYTPARAYLEPKSNLDVLLNSQVTKVIFEGDKAVGVEYLTSTGETKTLKAKKEIILSAGALNSPHILLLSGVGPRETLEQFDIPVVADLPVGQNLLNHVGATLQFLITKLDRKRPLDWAAATDYLLTREGPMSSTGITQVTGLLSSSFAKAGQPDIQYFFNGFYADCSAKGAVGEKVQCGSSYNVTSNAALLLPRSIGNVTLQSADPRDPPLLYPNFFAHPDDMLMAKESIQYLRQIFESPILQEEWGVTLDPEYSEACAHAGEEWSESWSECMIRTYTDPQNHQLGTTAIGLVVDPELKVYNLKNLRVCDAGSMPGQPTGNPQAAIMVVGEKCAANIKADWA